MKLPICLMMFLTSLILQMIIAQPKFASAAVNIEESDTLYTLSNGTITARISKSSGDMVSLVYNGMETLTDKSGHPGAYWSHDTTGGIETITRITIDPASNNGDWGEVSVKGISGGIKMGHGPGAAADGDFPADIDIRYSLGRDESGIYTYCIFDHLPEYPAASIAEARFCAKLANMYDWISIDEKRNKYYPAILPEEDKYCYTAIQSENLAYGFSSTIQKIGWWMINPTIEYLSGGPTKPEFLCHRDTTQVQAPCVLNYWRSSHYWGANASAFEGEHWTKVIGPFYLYMNTGTDGMDMWNDAKARAEMEKNKWPYAFVSDGGVSGEVYPPRDQRSTVSGKIILNDPLMPGGSRFIGKLMVGLAHAPYQAPSLLGGMREMIWQLDAKYYQFWAQVDDHSGQFVIPNVRPGTYTLYAFADGVLGEFSKTGITVPSGGDAINLGELEWIPVRKGMQLWDIGIANRTATEFANGDRFFEPGIQLEYPTIFPNDVHFIIGKSDCRSDWYFQHVPRNEDGNVSVVPYRGVAGVGKATPFSIHFQMSQAPRGRATLRIAICGTETSRVDVTVNSAAAGSIALDIPDGVISRHQVQGGWYERELAFNANLMKQGENVLTLTVPAGSMNSGMIYDYIRLELDESSIPQTEEPTPSDDTDKPMQTGSNRSCFINTAL